MSWLRYGWGNVQPQSTMVESLASSKEMPKQTQWYHSKQVRHCTISLRLECWVLNPRQNTHKKASNATHFHGRRGHIWLKVFPCPVSGSQMMWKGPSSLSGWKQQGGLCFVLYHTAPDSSQCCCIGFFKKPAAKVACKSSLKNADVSIVMPTCLEKRADNWL